MQTNTTAHQGSHRLPAPASRPVPAGTLSEAEIRQIIRETLG
ncbi:hypothetical protein [Roseomonas xinghualingensis]|nr:hypothetical protein [Roseomonas sp. SXEYE001]MCV4206402.1 hypothetical protein [Roseomonas sp. SXEYE001]